MPAEFESVGAVSIAEVMAPEWGLRWRRRRVAMAVKRLLDMTLGLAALILLSPVFALIALLIVVNSPGPVIFRQRRVGRGGRTFAMYKFRSMQHDAEQHLHRLLPLNEADGPVFKLRQDPRVTRMGRFLRSWSLDELPQLFNVLRGEMSLVGPRPPLPQEVAQYGPRELRRLQVKPGMTCLWQIRGRSDVSFDEWITLDLEYISNWSIWLDLSVLLHTIPAVLSRRGAY